MKPMKRHLGMLRKLVVLPGLFVEFIGFALGQEKPNVAVVERSGVSENRKDDQPVAHRFRWNRWGYGQEPEVFMDDVSIGKGKDAAKKMAAMQFPKKTRLQVEFPQMPDGALGGVNKNGFGVLPYFKEEEFLREWIYQGVRINIIVNGKPHEFHTLAVIDGKKRAVEPLHTGDFDPNGSGGTFFFDGKEIDRASGVIQSMSEVPWTAGSLFVIYHSDNHLDTNGRGIRINEIAGAVRFLAGRHVRVIDSGFGEF